jgi:hypothetical protein
METFESDINKLVIKLAGLKIFEFQGGPDFLGAQMERL